MTLARIAIRGLAHRWRQNLAVALGAAVATAVLIGALGAGDTVRYSLRRLTMLRLGDIEQAMEGGDRFFRAALAQDMEASLGGRASALIVLRGYASARGGEASVSPIQVIGVDEDFWDLAPKGPAQFPAAEEVLLSAGLARRLQVGPGEEVLIRAQAPDAMPAEAPLAAGAASDIAFRLTVAGIAAEQELGQFSLRPGQSEPMNAFVSRELLAGRIGRSGKANTLVAALEGARTAENAQAALTAQWTLEDAGLSVSRIPGARELASDRIFIESPVEEAALMEGGEGILTYFVDRISADGRVIPYSFVSSLSGPRAGFDLSPGEILLNRWAAEDLQAEIGDEVEILYQVPGQGGALEKKSTTLRLAGIVDMEQGDRNLMPRFPGISGAENCRDWNTGFPLDFSVIRPRDEQYWDLWAGTPKAFVSVADARRMWANRFGSATAIRFPDGSFFTDSFTDAELGARVLSRIRPETLGMSFASVRETGLQASSSGVDFGQLFLGLSLFLVASGLLLAALLFLLSLELRGRDAFVLSAVGFDSKRIAWVLLLECALVAVAGSSAGAPLGLAWHRIIVSGLRSAWQEAVRTPALIPHLAPASVVAGSVMGLAASLAVILPVAARLALRASRGASRRKRPASDRALVASIVTAAAGAAGAAALLALADPPLSSLGSGALLLVGSLSAVNLLLGRMARGRPGRRLRTGAVAMANAGRRRTRSLAVASLVACALFMISAVASQRREIPDPSSRSSGTGGFGLIVEVAVPLSGDLPVPPEARAIGFRVIDGDDASCLNLNRVQTPRILAIDPELLSGSFGFATFAPQYASGDPARDPWLLLDEDLGPEVIPAIADQTVITWGLGKAIGDDLVYTDERGGELRLRLVAGLANSIFQGSVIVGEEALLRHFPSASGKRFFLVESRSLETGSLEATLARTLSSKGISIASTAARLAELDSVENTYLSIFASLGTLGMLIGSLGLAFVTLRNVMESRGELALLSAVGFRRSRIFSLVFLEHCIALGLGVAAGGVSSLIAVVPSSAAGYSVPQILQVLAAVSASGMACIAAAASTALRPDLLAFLRSE